MTTQTLPPLRRSRSLKVAAWMGAVLSALLLMRLIAQALPSAEGTTGLLGPVFAFLDASPFVLVFLSVAAGYALARVKIRSFSLGATASTLLFCLALSLWASLRGVAFNVPDFASTLMFNLFMFAVGMKVGPQFLSGLRRDARAFISIALLVPLLSIAAMLAVNAVFDLAPGIGLGIFSGANTATPGFGAAKDVYLSAGSGGQVAVSNMSAAFAFSYCLSLVLLVLEMKVLPRWFGKDQVAEAQAYQREIEKGATSPLPGTADALRKPELSVEVRAYRVLRSELFGKTLGELRPLFPDVALERVVRAGRRLEPAEDLRLQRDDVVVLSGALGAMVRAEEEVGEEIPDPVLLSVGLETVEVVVQTDRAAGKSVAELMRAAGRGFVVNAFFRGGAQIPFGPDTLVEKGDVFRLTGSGERIRRLEAQIGRRMVHETTATDMITLVVGLAVGALLGAIPIPLFGLRLSLGSAVALLVTGIVLSSLRTRNPAFGGPFPEPARQFIEDLGLNVFIAITALNAGAGVIRSLETGALLPIVVGTVVVGLLPPIAGWAFGQYRHKLNAGLLAGAVAGARCNSVGMRVAQEDTRSTVPAISYPVTFAISNVVLTLACYLMATVG